MIKVFFIGWTILIYLVIRDFKPDSILPDENATKEIKVTTKAELGRLLFFDARLSYNQMKSCGSCHSPELAFSDGYKKSLGAEGKSVLHNAPGLQNISTYIHFTWSDPNIKSLESQILKPMFASQPLELGWKNNENLILDRLKSDAAMLIRFKAVFPDEPNPINQNNTIDAIVSYEKTLVSFDSPYDRYLKGDKKALSKSAQRGRNLFFSLRLKCGKCHQGSNLGSGAVAQYENNGMSNLYGLNLSLLKDTGLFQYSRDSQDFGKFRVPSLRNVAITAPYLHDGSVATLTEIIDLYKAGGELGSSQNGNKEPNKSKLIQGFSMSNQEKLDLLNFLYALTDSTFINKHMNDGEIHENL